MDGCSTSASTTPNSSKPAERGAAATSPRTTANGGPWSNDPSPGSSPEAIGASATAASNATSSASPTGSPRSTSGASSTSASTTTADAGHWRETPADAKQTTTPTGFTPTPA